MTEHKQKSLMRQDRALAGLRWFFVIGVSLVILVARLLSDDPVDTYTDLAIAFGVGAGIATILTVSVWVQSLNPAVPFLLSGCDLGLAGLYVYISDGEPVIALGVAGFLAVSGLLRLGAEWGGVHALGVIAIAFGVGMYLLIQDSPDQSLDTDQLLDLYALPLLASVLLAVAAGIWAYAQSGGPDEEVIQIQKTAKAHEKGLAEMRERSRAIAQMTATISSTLDHKKVLEAALDIGQLGLDQRSGQRVASMVLLFSSNEDELYVASSRGLKSTDDHVTIPGVDGIVAKALAEAKPVIGKDSAKDPELSKFMGLHGARSLLVIPLRAHYDNFGVLIFGCNLPNVFREDISDVLTTLGVQVTVALQNASLYSTLMDEREVIVQLEEDARKALVRDLHDIPTQTISAVAMRLRIIQRMMETEIQNVPAELRAAESMALRATEEIRHVLFKLRPLALETSGLTSALNQLAEKMEQTYRQPCTMDIHPDVEVYLDESKQGALFYLIEEAVNNARKYAQASMITVQAKPQDSMIAVRIKDNGVGFDVDSVNKSYSKRGSFGMVNMKERADLLDGILTIDSEKGKGTAITVMIPIDFSAKSTTTGIYAQVPRTKLAASARRRVERPQ